MFDLQSAITDRLLNKETPKIYIVINHVNPKDGNYSDEEFSYSCTRSTLQEAIDYVKELGVYDTNYDDLEAEEKDRVCTLYTIMQIDLAIKAPYLNERRIEVTRELLG